ncbi:MAG TPA: hypothetical protein VGJ09_19500 [Bryobacteraceae bacterium]
MDLFSELEQASDRPLAAADLLIEHLAQQHRWAEWFQARVMRTRLELGSVPDTVQIENAREAGKRYIEDGDILRAWPYFRAVGEHQPMIDAIGNLQPDQFNEEILGLSFQERLNPKKALELLLASSGICRAITVFEQYPDPGTWEDGLAIITGALHAELLQNLKQAIARREDATPGSDNIPELIAGREWLFGEYDSYVDASHLFGILRLAIESARPETLCLALEMAEYGCCLSASFRPATPPPFDDYCRDHAIYLKALLGQEADAAIDHFRRKESSAEVLVRLLLRLGRPGEAVKVFEQHLLDRDPAFLSCPDLAQLCQQAGDFDRLQKLSRDRNDPVGVLQAALSKRAGS